MQYCAERVVGGDPFAVLLADDFLTDYEPGVTAGLTQAFASSRKLQLSVMEVDGPDISKYGVVVPNGAGAGIAGLVEKSRCGSCTLKPGLYRKLCSNV